jgi:predicted nucleic acid-binding protein
MLVSRARLDEAQRRELENEVASLVADDVLEVVTGEHYSHLRGIALRRVPRDERDWPTVAAALTLDVSILTADADFLGCGVATWTVETLIAELATS